MTATVYRLFMGVCALSILTGCTLPSTKVLSAETEIQFERISAELTSLQRTLASSAEQTERRLTGDIAAQLTELRSTVATVSRQVEGCYPENRMPPQQRCEIPPVVLQDERMIVGEVEWVTLLPPRLILTARIDTGARSSSLHAANLTSFERDGDDWVRFELSVGDRTETFERPVLKYVRVFQQSDKQGTRRPVVEMRVNVGNVSDTFEFTLADRAHLKYEMILGRNFLTDLALVDVGQRYVQPLPD